MTTEVTNSGEHEDSTTAEVAADALDPLIGQTIDGRFRIVEVIGKGAMGKVYRAVQLPLNRAVAIKLLDSRYGAGKDESFKQRFLVEAALTSKLNHPNTVRVLDYGSTRDGLFFLAMEYLDGETLEKLLTTKGALPWHRVLSIGQQMARALREAHELGVVHRDLKPGNVVLLHADDDNDFVKVLDFGLVKSFVEGHELEGRAITQQGMLMGSPPYMAPEQGEKNRADPRSDIYSLGTMLFEMLTGKPPFSGGGALEVILKHVHQPVPAMVAPSKFEPVPEALQAIVMRCLAKSPMDRFQSMDELLIALQDVSVPTRTIEAEPQPKTEAAVPVVTPPPEEPDPVLIAPPSRGPSALLLGGFFVAAVAGVLGTWAIVKPVAPTRLVFHVESVPAGASVIVEGKTLGVTPIDLEQALGQGNRASLDLRLEKVGFAPSQVRLTGGGGRLEVTQTLSALQAVAPKVEEPKKPEPVVAKPEEPKKVEPVPAPVVTKPEPVKAEPVVKKVQKQVAAAKPEPKKKPTAAPAPTPSPAAPPPGTPRPASKLDEDDEGAPVRSELKRPTAQP
jgi:tRNA A-37 threonylcarbamoyl transferase component Bud32